MAAGKNVFVRPNNVKNDDKKKKEKKLPKDVIEEKDKQDDQESTKLDPNKCQSKLPNIELKTIEREFWTRIDIKGIFFIGGSMGKHKGGVSALQVTNNNRLVAISLDNGNLLLYDMAYQNKKIDNEEDGSSPFLIRAISNIKGVIKHIEFSEDCFSQVLVVFEDGNVKVFHINQNNGKIVDRCRYATKEQLKHRSVFEMKEKISMNYNFCLSEDEANNYLPGTNLRLTKAMFHPSFTFTGTQHSYMLN